MKNSLFAFVCACVLCSGTYAADNPLFGAGATFPAPVYQRWASAYSQQGRDQVRYLPEGSGSGINMVSQGLCDFGATDRPLTQQELQQEQLIQFPMLIASVVPIYNIPNVDSLQLHLTGPVLARIYLGQITLWNDPAITRINPDIKLPEHPITVVHRNEKSGTTWIFTKYLSAVSPLWAKPMGTHENLAWPCGMASQGNAAMVTTVKLIPGTIGYVQDTYAELGGACRAMLLNKGGHYVQPSVKSCKAAAASAEISPTMVLDMMNADGRDSWPIVSASYILVSSKSDRCQKLPALLAYFHWCSTEGKSILSELNYHPLPDRLTQQIIQFWNNISCNGKPVWP